jgi:hypothetical protein
MSFLALTAWEPGAAFLQQVHRKVTVDTLETMAMAGVFRLIAA